MSIMTSSLSGRKSFSKKKANPKQKNRTYPDTDGADGDQQHKAVQILKKTWKKINDIPSVPS